MLALQVQQLPFLFDVATDGGRPTVTLRNGEERLKLDEITTAGDSTTIKLGVFDAALVVRADGEGKLTGAWVKYDAGKPYRVPFTAAEGESHLFDDQMSTQSKFVPQITGISKNTPYRVTFKDKEGGSYDAVGVFNYKSGNTVTGTFLTTTGDYRYLSGGVVERKDGPHLLLSTFDGSHGFLFDAKEW